MTRAGAAAAAPGARQLAVASEESSSPKYASGHHCAEMCMNLYVHVHRVLSKVPTRSVGGPLQFPAYYTRGSKTIKVVMIYAADLHRSGVAR